MEHMKWTPISTLDAAQNQEEQQTEVEVLLATPEKSQTEQEMEARPARQQAASNSATTVCLSLYLCTLSKLIFLLRIILSLHLHETGIKRLLVTDDHDLNYDDKHCPETL